MFNVEPVVHKFGSEDELYCGAFFLCPEDVMVFMGLSFGLQQQMCMPRRSCIIIPWVLADMKTTLPVGVLECTSTGAQGAAI